MTSNSRDGSIQARILKFFGYRVVRGSSSRGGAAGLKGLIDVVQKENRNASLAVDGPRGPIYKVKPGMMKLAQATQCPIIPAAAASSRRYVFKKAWNRCYLPLPFARCVVVYGEPVGVSLDSSLEDIERIRGQLENRLIELKAEAEFTFHRKFQPAPSPILVSQPT